MLVICEPRFTFIDEGDNEEVFYTVDQVENQKYLRGEIVAILTDLFPDKIGNIESIRDSVYGITVFDSDDMDNEQEAFNDYNAQKNSLDIRYEGKTINTTLQLYTFMNRNNYAVNMILSEAQVKQLQNNASNLSGVDNKLNNVILSTGDLSGVNFNNSTINNANFYDTLLVATKFADTTFTDINFSGADMRYAEFEVSTLTNVNFNKADLRHANFSGSTLTDVDLRDADLRHAHLEYVTFAGNCKLDGAKFVNLPDILEKIPDYPPNLFDNVINTEEDEEEMDEDEGEYEVDEREFLKANEGIFSSADVKPGDVHEEMDEEEEDVYVNTKPPLCLDMINGADINIQAYLAKSDANFSVQLPNSDKYECVNLNDIKRYHMKTDKADKKYFNYSYACNSDNPYYAFTEDNYIRAQAYIRIGSFSLLVEKPEWFPEAEYPIHRKFKLVNSGSKPAFVTETMLRHGEQGDDDYISSEWHCNAGKMETYKLEPLMEGGRKYKKTKKTKKIYKKTIKNMKKTQKNKNKKTQKKKFKKYKNKNKKTHKL